MSKTKFVKIVSPKKRAPAEESETLELEEEDPSEEELETSEKISDFQAKFSGKQYKVRIERFNAGEGDWEWVTRLPLEGFEPFNVLPKYGGGKYKAVLMDEGGRYVKGGIMEFRFAMPIETLENEKPRSALEDPAVLMVLEQQKQLPVMLMEILKSIIPAQAASASKGLDAAQMMDMLAKFTTLTAPKENSMKSFMEMVSLWEKAKDAFTPDEKESGGIVSEIKEAMGALALLPQIRNQIPAPAVLPGTPQILSPTAPIVLPKAPKGKPAVKETSPAIQKVLFYVPKLEEAARENQPVEKWAEKVLDIIDDEVVPALVKEYNGFVSEESIWDRLLVAAKGEERESLFIHAPALLPYKDWVGAVINEAVRIAESPDPEDLPVNGQSA